MLNDNRKFDSRLSKRLLVLFISEMMIELISLFDYLHLLLLFTVGIHMQRYDFISA